MKNRSKKGLRIRPCHVCGLPVNFIHWKDHPPRVFHWANPNGSHHVHTQQNSPTKDEERRQIQHLQEIVNEQYLPWFSENLGQE